MRRRPDRERRGADRDGREREGKGELLGVTVVTTEAGAGWLALPRGVLLAISDAHAGLRDASAATLAGAASQRCRTHFIRDR